MKTAIPGGLLMILPSWTWAAEELPAVGPIVLQLLLVLGLIGACTWVVRRTPLARRAGRSLAIKETLPLGARDRLVIVRFEERELLLGINSNGISLLSEREAALESDGGAENDSPSRSFLDLLGQRP